MEILDLRHFSSLDLRPLLDDETQLWSRLLSWDYTSSAEMILRYVDAKILPGYAAVDRGRVFGYSFFVYEGSKGVIGDLYVTNGTRLPDARKVEINLLTHVIETLQQSPGIHRVEAQLLVHQSGSVSEPFVKEGFRVFPRRAHEDDRPVGPVGPVGFVGFVAFVAVLPHDPGNPVRTARLAADVEGAEHCAKTYQKSGHFSIIHRIRPNFSLR